MSKYSQFLVLIFRQEGLPTMFVFTMWSASEAARCPAKPNVGFIKILKFNWSPGHSANMLIKLIIDRERRYENASHVGGIDQSIHIEVFGDLHEFGRLGKTVTLEEVKRTMTN